MILSNMFGYHYQSLMIKLPNLFYQVQLSMKIVIFVFFSFTRNYSKYRFGYFVDNKHRSYDDIIQAYAKAVNTPLIQTNQGKEFYYEDQRIIYCAYFHSDKTHILIDVIRKGQTKTDLHIYAHLNTHKKATEDSFVSLQPYKYDLMISYSHKDKEFAHQLYHRLVESNYRVWIDLDNMYGPIVERMAEAIENSEFVLLCMSNAYKSSTYCQLEAEYAFKFQTFFIPLVVKNNFTQTGWLGMLCGLRLHINFVKASFDDAYQNLCTEIQRYRKNTRGCATFGSTYVGHLTA